MQILLVALSSSETGAEVGVDGAPTLHSSKLDEAPLCIMLFSAPILGHGIQIAVKFQKCF